MCREFLRTQRRRTAEHGREPQPHVAESGPFDLELLLKNRSLYPTVEIWNGHAEIYLFFVNTECSGVTKYAGVQLNAHIGQRQSRIGQYVAVLKAVGYNDSLRAHRSPRVGAGFHVLRGSVRRT